MNTKTFSKEYLKSLPERHVMELKPTRNDRYHHSHLVVGMGEVGSALHEVLSSRYEVWGFDPKVPMPDLPEDKFDVLHITFPPIKRFIEEVRKYEKKYRKPDGLTIVHSSVPMGTCRQLNAIHSPIRGVHPNLAKGIRTFTKYFGGERAVDASEYFLDLGIKTMITDKPENTEAGKLLDTTYYGWNIVFEKAVHDFCEKEGLDFDIVYTHFNESYNYGYVELGRANVVRPVLKHMDGPIGGHCVLANIDLFDSPICDIIREANATY